MLQSPHTIVGTGRKVSCAGLNWLGLHLEFGIKGRMTKSCLELGIQVISIFTTTTSASCLTSLGNSGLLRRWVRLGSDLQPLLILVTSCPIPICPLLPILSCPIMVYKFKCALSLSLHFWIVRIIWSQGFAWELFSFKWGWAWCPSASFYWSGRTESPSFEKDSKSFFSHKAEETVNMWLNYI